MKRKKREDSFWSRPDGMSIVDVLALGFAITYWLLVVMVIFGGPAMAGLATIQANMNLPISTILAGYFSDQVVRHWQRDKAEIVEMQIESDKEKPTI